MVIRPGLDGDLSRFGRSFVPVWMVLFFLKSVMQTTSWATFFPEFSEKLPSLFHK
jgi:tryptophan-rich sensory protein